MGHRTHTSVVVAGVAVAALLTGCGVKGTPKAGEIDVRTLDVGNYAVDRHSYDQNPSGQGGLLEGMRMSRAVVPTIKIDPSLSVGAGGRVVVDTTDATTHLLAGVSKPVLDNHNMIVGYVGSGADKPAAPGAAAPGPGATAVTNLVMRFPDVDGAKQAARELEDADFAVAPDLNRKLTLSKYPDAYIHYRPGIANVGTFMAYKQFVISLFVERPSADEQDLTSWVQKTLDAEVPSLDTFQPTAKADLGTLKPDPEGLLARAVVRDRSTLTPDPDKFATYGAPAFVHNADDETVRQRLVDDTGLDAVAFAESSSVLRVRDADAGTRLVKGLISSAGEEYDPADAPANVPGAQCLQLNSKGDSAHENKFRCYVVYRRYVEIVNSDVRTDVQQRTAAAYALLANSL